MDKGFCSAQCFTRPRWCSLASTPQPCVWRGGASDEAGADRRLEILSIGNKRATLFNRILSIFKKFVSTSAVSKNSRDQKTEKYNIYVTVSPFLSPSSMKR